MLKILMTLFLFMIWLPVNAQPDYDLTVLNHSTRMIRVTEQFHRPLYLAPQEQGGMMHNTYAGGLYGVSIQYEDVSGIYVPVEHCPSDTVWGVTLFIEQISINAAPYCR